MLNQYYSLCIFNFDEFIQFLPIYSINPKVNIPPIIINQYINQSELVNQTKRNMACKYMMLLPVVLILVIQQLLNVKEVKALIERTLCFNSDWKLVLAGKACPFSYKKVGLERQSEGETSGSVCENEMQEVSVGC